MRCTRIIPCLDLARGRVVKGTRFLELQDAGDPLELALYYNRAGADELFLLDIAPGGRPELLDLLTQLAPQVSIPLVVGGGIRTLAEMEQILAAGASRVSLGTVVLDEPEVLRQGVKHFGSQRLVVAVDAGRVAANQWEVYVQGGRQATGRDVLEWAQYVEQLGAGEILLTSMTRDGTREGYDLALTKAVSESVSLPIIASGGVGQLHHFWEGAVLGKAEGLLAASVFHYALLQIAEVKKYLREREVHVCMSP